MALSSCVEVEPGEIGSDLCLQTFHRPAGAGEVIDQREPSEVEAGSRTLVDVAGRKFGDEFTGVSKLDIALVGQRNAVFRRVRSETRRPYARHRWLSALASTSAGCDGTKTNGSGICGSGSGLGIEGDVEQRLSHSELGVVAGSEVEIHTAIVPDTSAVRHRSRSHYFSSQR